VLGAGRKRNKTFRTRKEGRYRRATFLDLKGHTQISAVPAVTIDWDRVIAKIA
jgi:hypothetical protein